MLQRPSGTLVLFTDCCTADPRLGLWRGLVLQRHAKAVLCDLAHGPVAGNVAVAACWLRLAAARFPAGTTFVAGTAAGQHDRLLAVAAHGCCWFAADNGMLGEVIATAGQPELRLLDLDHLGLRPATGRSGDLEVLAAAAGLLASGRYGFSALGPRAEPQHSLPPRVPGMHRVIQVAGDGCLTLDLPADSLLPGALLQVGAQPIRYQGNGACAVGQELVARAGAFGLVEVVGGQNGAAAALAVSLGDLVGILQRQGNA